jgi:hypothetical protein
MANKKWSKRRPWQFSGMVLSGQFLRVENWTNKGKEGLTIYLLQDREESGINVLRSKCPPFETPEKLEPITITARLSGRRTHDGALAALEVHEIKTAPSSVVDAVTPDPPAIDSSELFSTKASQEDSAPPNRLHLIQ